MCCDVLFITVAFLAGSTHSYLTQYMPKNAGTMCDVQYDLQIRQSPHLRTLL
jgi:hypothetical protein